ncbi:HAD hydrolase-like protein [Pseudopontixanthobacter vadosimaris]|uniref:HAD hydrolase-like protein n=1 Tax=Pseudopontixanthobacter vadosimaris TaxID=2726450 RepID=UPI0014747398|nr:HAD hydrolase-like protein [Pseudopontixanthobacter vadosimaris]
MADFLFDIVGFDLDGTLLDTHQDLGAAVNHALQLANRPAVPVERIESLIGGGAKLMLRRALEETGGISDEDFRPLYKALLAYYGEHNADLSRPYPGVVDTLEELARRGVKLAVVTNKFESFAADILRKLSLDHHFGAVIGGDTMGKGRAKPAPDPIFEIIRRLAGADAGTARAAFVGDSSYDIGSARAAGVPVIAAAYGYCDRPAQDLGADAVIDTMADCIAALESLRS